MEKEQKLESPRGWGSVETAAGDAVVMERRIDLGMRREERGRVEQAVLMLKTQEHYSGSGMLATAMVFWCEGPVVMAREVGVDYRWAERSRGLSAMALYAAVFSSAAVEKLVLDARRHYAAPEDVEALERAEAEGMVASVSWSMKDSHKAIVHVARNRRDVIDRYRSHGNPAVRSGGDRLLELHGLRSHANAEELQIAEAAIYALPMPQIEECVLIYRESRS